MVLIMEYIKIKNKYQAMTLKLITQNAFNIFEEKLIKEKGTDKALENIDFKLNYAKALHYLYRESDKIIKEAIKRGEKEFNKGSE